MFGATREKTRLWLLILVGVVATLLGQTHAREIFAPLPSASGEITASTPASTGDFYDGDRYDVPDSLLALSETAKANGGKLNNWPMNANRTVATTIDVGGGKTITSSVSGGMYAEQAALSQVSQPWVMATSNNFCKEMCRPMLQDRGAMLLKAGKRDRGEKIAVFPDEVNTR